MVCIIHFLQSFRIPLLSYKSIAEYNNYNIYKYLYTIPISIGGRIATWDPEFQFKEDISEQFKMQDYFYNKLSEIYNSMANTGKREKNQLYRTTLLFPLCIEIYNLMI